MSIDIAPVVAPADHLPGPPQGQWTYADYAVLPNDDLRYEILDGVLYMSPAPTLEHQGSAARFVYHLMTHIDFAGLGRVFPAPVDVELAPDRVVQPDVVVVLMQNLGVLAGSRIIGAPDLVVEIVSPATAGYDRREKQDAYARAGVPEYWIADPASRTIEVLTLEQGRYRSLHVFARQARLPSRVLPDFPVVVEQFFA